MQVEYVGLRPLTLANGYRMAVLEELAEQIREHVLLAPDPPTNLPVIRVAIDPDAEVITQPRTGGAASS